MARDPTHNAEETHAKDHNHHIEGQMSSTSGVPPIVGQHQGGTISGFCTGN